MNRENLNQLLQNYISNFDYINDDVRMEYYKWEAVQHFQQHWDIDAADFASMFKEAVKETYNLINNKTVQPTNGIIKLAQRPELTETVRQMFRDLLADDGGDIDKRQEKINFFVAKADELLNTYESGKWKYAQDVRTVIFYLCLLQPEQNYIFKATKAKEFRNCVEYGNDFGSGASFSLRKYYDMCDQLVAAIKETPQLVELHTRRLTEKMYADDDYHILAYDIIYCAIEYNLYNNITIVKPKPARTRTSTQSKQHEEKQEQLRQELDRIVRELNSALQERTEFDDFSAKGLIVQHRVFGDGIVTEHNDSLITVRFQEQEKRFQLPQGFAGGFLKTASAEIAEMFRSMAELDSQIEKLKTAKSAVSHQLHSLI